MAKLDPTPLLRLAIYRPVLSYSQRVGPSAEPSCRRVVRIDLQGQIHKRQCLVARLTRHFAHRCQSPEIEVIGIEAFWSVPTRSLVLGGFETRRHGADHPGGY